MDVQREVMMSVAQFEDSLYKIAREDNKKITQQSLLPIEKHFYGKVDALMIQLQNIFLEWHRVSEKCTVVSLSDEATLSVWKSHASSVRVHEAAWRLLSLAQGAYANANRLGAALDIPAQAWLHIQAVACLAHAYGFSIKSPLESFYAIRLMYIGYLPKQDQWREWSVLLDELREHEKGQLLYRAEKEISRREITSALCLQLLKIGLCMRGKRTRWVAVSVGGVINYQYARNVIALAKAFYQKRWLMRQKNMQVTG
ncbi:EcsC family protein [Bacillus sp. FSL W7-1360]